MAANMPVFRNLFEKLIPLTFIDRLEQGSSLTYKFSELPICVILILRQHFYHKQDNILQAFDAESHLSKWYC